MKTYKIVRFYSNPDTRKRTIYGGLTLEEAQAHCQDPQSCSKTCTTKVGMARTKQTGPWFDGYTEE